MNSSQKLARRITDDTLPRANSYIGTNEHSWQARSAILTAESL
jgi:hypothetical protein